SDCLADSRRGWWGFTSAIASSFDDRRTLNFSALYRHNNHRQLLLALKPRLHRSAKVAVANIGAKITRQRTTLLAMKDAGICGAQRRDGVQIHRDDDFIVKLRMIYSYARDGFGTEICAIAAFAAAIAATSCACGVNHLLFRFRLLNQRAG